MARSISTVGIRGCGSREHLASEGRDFNDQIGVDVVAHIERIVERDFAALSVDGCEFGMIDIEGLLVGCDHLEWPEWLAAIAFVNWFRVIGLAPGFGRDVDLPDSWYHIV